MHCPQPANVLVTGATGFIGSAVLRALRAYSDVNVRALVRRAPDSDSDVGAATFVVGDVTDPTSLADACRGVHTVVHAASYVGADPRQCLAVNAAGTAALAEAASRSGVARLIYVSTASVYGRSCHNGVAPPPSQYQPASPASRSRLLAERVVQRNGGWVVRPHLVYGNGDRWFVPAFADLLAAANGHIDSPALVSTIMVDDLAGALCALATHATDRLPRGAAVDVNHPNPTSVTAISEAVANALRLDIPDRPLSVATIRQRLPDEGPARRHLSLFEHHRWYASDDVWRIVDHAPGVPFADGVARCADWYQRFLSRQLAAAPTH